MTSNNEGVPKTRMRRSCTRNVAGMPQECATPPSRHMQSAGPSLTRYDPEKALRYADGCCYSWRGRRCTEQKTVHPTGQLFRSRHAKAELPAAALKNDNGFAVKNSSPRRAAFEVEQGHTPLSGSRETNICADTRASMAAQTGRSTERSVSQPVQTARSVVSRLHAPHFLAFFV